MGWGGASRDANGTQRDRRGLAERRGPWGWRDGTPVGCRGRDAVGWRGLGAAPPGGGTGRPWDDRTARSLRMAGTGCGGMTGWRGPWGWRDGTLVRWRGGGGGGGAVPGVGGVSGDGRVFERRGSGNGAAGRGRRSESGHGRRGRGSAAGGWVRTGERCRGAGVRRSDLCPPSCGNTPRGPQAHTPPRDAERRSRQSCFPRAPHPGATLRSRAPDRQLSPTNGCG